MRTKDSKKMGDVRAFLEREPHYFSEIEASLKIPKASLARYLADLKGLGDIDKGSDGRWASTRNVNADMRVYNSERELRDARKHTKSILLTSRDVQGIEDYSLPETVKSLALHGLLERETYGPGDYRLGTSFSGPQLGNLLQHLRTGYRREFWDYLEKYASLQKRHKFPRGGYYLEDLEEPTSRHSFNGQVARLLVGGVRDPFAYEFFMKFLGGGIPLASTKEEETRKIIEEAREKSGDSPEFRDAFKRYNQAKATFEEEEAALREGLRKIPKADMAKARELLNMLVGQIERIVEEGKSDIPLKGVCDFCPREKVQVREGQKAQTKKQGLADLR
jgi:hypothetical protein